MPVQPGDRLPSLTMKQWIDGAMQEVNTDDLFKGKVVLFGVPGAFTPTCSLKHLPGYVEHAADFKAKGVERIVCMAVNDPFVLSTWAQQNKAEAAITMLPDGNAELTRALDLEMNGAPYSMGPRCQRFSALVEDGVVKSVHVEKPGSFEVSGADVLLKEI